MLGGLLGGRVRPLHGVRLRKGAARIGYIQPVLSLRMPFWQSFFDTLRERGWREGVDFALEVRETLGDPARALQAARELVRQQVDIIIAISTAPAVAARQVTDRVPVVTWCGYPVEAGLAASLSRPGGNVTGVANYAGGEVWGKFVALLRELRPELGQLGILWDYTPPAFPDGLVPLPYIQSSARQAGIETRVWMTRTEADLVDALSEIDASPIGALIISTGGGVHMQPAVLERIAALIARRGCPRSLISRPPPYSAARAACSPTPPTLRRYSGGWRSSSTAFCAARARRSCHSSCPRGSYSRSTPGMQRRSA
jgi:hypothetical protein